MQIQAKNLGIIKSDHAYPTENFLKDITRSNSVSEIKKKVNFDFFNFAVCTNKKKEKNNFSRLIRTKNRAAPELQPKNFARTTELIVKTV